MNIDSKDQLIIHIEGLQATLTKRNARIAQLEDQLANVNAKHVNQLANSIAYKKGWKDCANQLSTISRETALQLAKVNKEAWRIYNREDN